MVQFQKQYYLRLLERDINMRIMGENKIDPTIVIPGILVSLARILYQHVFQKTPILTTHTNIHGAGNADHQYYRKYDDAVDAWTPTI